MSDSEVELPRDSRSPRAARRMVADALERRSFPERSVEDAMLLVSELVTNALMYSTGNIALTCDVDGDTARISVSDASPTLPQVAATEPDADEPTGRGLLIIERTAARWGVDVADGCKTVWFEICR